MAYIETAQQLRGSVASWHLLHVVALSKSFGLRTAVTDVTFAVGHGEVVGLIGPARSGRSTIIHLLAGTVAPTFGRITIAGKDVTQLAPDARSRRGIISALHLPELFRDLTVLECVLMGGATSQPPFFSRRGGKSYQDDAMATLELAGLGGMSHVRAEALSPCQQCFLAIAVALAARPVLLLLDDPAAGMTQAERTTLRSLIGSIREAGTSVLLAERDISILTEACDRMLVLSSGRIIADDVPSRIARNPVVMEAYLNRSQ